MSGGSQVTVGILQAIAELGLAVPGDISFVAYNDSAFYESWQPRLTAIALPVREIALAGSAALIRRIRDRGARSDATADNQHALYLPRLKIRRSTAAPTAQPALRAEVRIDRGAEPHKDGRSARLRGSGAKSGNRRRSTYQPGRNRRCHSFV